LPPLFSPAVTLHLVRLAWELPELAGRSLSQWDCPELARQLARDGVVVAISAQTVQRLLASQRLKPWRQHVWLHPRTPRDAAFVVHVRLVADLLTRPLAPDESLPLSAAKGGAQPGRDDLAATPPAPGPHPAGAAGRAPAGGA
jgi:hypothetical protein